MSAFCMPCRVPPVAYCEWAAAGWRTAAVSSLRDTQGWAAHLLQRLQQADPLKKFVRIRQDVVAAYIYSAVFTGQAHVHRKRPIRTVLTARREIS